MKTISSLLKCEGNIIIQVEGLRYIEWPMSVNAKGARSLK